MAELEIHHESEHRIDPAGQRVGVLAALLAVALAIVTIASHRTHTGAILHRSSANDAWAHYQSDRIKFHNLELGESLARLVGSGPAAEKMLGESSRDRKKYEEQSRTIQEEARRDEEAAESDERRALRYDIGEGLLEIALVMSSLFFISRKMMFPALGVAAGIVGAVVAVAGLFV
jgi:hypothetical protein